jgi:hypothetical protein
MIPFREWKNPGSFGFSLILSYSSAETQRLLLEALCVPAYHLGIGRRVVHVRDVKDIKFLDMSKKDINFLDMSKKTLIF